MKGPLGMERLFFSEEAQWTAPGGRGCISFAGYPGRYVNEGFVYGDLSP